MTHEPATPSGAGSGPDDLRTLLVARARDLAAPRAEAVVARPALLVLHAGSLRCAVAAHRVREVLAPAVVSGLPRRGHDLVGLRATRRGAVPVADLCRLAGEPALDPGRAQVVVLDADEPLGLLAEAVELVEQPDGEAGVAAPVPVAIPGTVGADGVVRLDVDALLADSRLRVPRPASPDDTDPRDPQGAPWTSS